MPAGSRSRGPLTTKKRLKLLFIVLLSSISLTASGCSPDASEQPQAYDRSDIKLSAEDELLNSEPTSWDGPQRYESVIVDIQTGAGGYCCLMSDMEIMFGEQGAERILMEQPVLLSFAVSSEHQGGLWVMDLDQGEEALENLYDVKTALRDTGNHDLADKIVFVIEQIEASGPFTQAST